MEPSHAPERRLGPVKRRFDPQVHLRSLNTHLVDRPMARAIAAEGLRNDRPVGQIGPVRGVPSPERKVGAAGSTPERKEDRFGTAAAKGCGSIERRSEDRRAFEGHKEVRPN